MKRLLDWIVLIGLIAFAILAASCEVEELTECGIVYETVVKTLPNGEEVELIEQKMVCND